MATFNGADYVEEQLSSILAGAVVPDQIVIADDHSTDDTVAIVRRRFASHAGAGTQLLILEGQDQLGVTANFERAIAACDGDLVVLSDQDDVWHEDRLSAAIPAFEADPALSFQHTNARLVDATGQPLGVSLFEALTVRTSEREALVSGHPLTAYIRRNLATGATVAFRRELGELARPFPAEWVHDEWLAIIAAAMGRVQLLDRELVDYRQHGSNQIGVAAPTFSYRISRFLTPRHDRYVTLARRTAILADRLDELGASAEVRDLVRQKARFESVRAALPRIRVLRVPAVLGEALRGSYRHLSSQGSIDIARDLLQPA